MNPAQIRPAHDSDRDFVIETAARLVDFGPPGWRPAAEVVGGEVRTLDGFFDAPESGTALLVAERDGTLLGFVYLQPLQDYFTLEWHGHVGIIAVAADAEGAGAGTALMSAAETWARDAGYTRLTLSVFEHNARARRLYEHLGFQPDTIRYLKELR